MTNLFDSIPLGAPEAWLVPLLPLAAFVVLAMGFHRARALSSVLAIAAVGTAFVVSLGVLGDYLVSGEQGGSWSWLQIGDSEFRIGYSVDALSAMMLVLVTSVSLGVQVYSLEYMKGEPRFGWYFAAHSLFVASMLGLVLTDSLLLLYATWELVGLSSFLLIGFWFERRAAAEAAKKAFITTRLGDVGLLIGILILFLEAGRTFSIGAVFEA
ncbi:MAG: proton-conducting transporter membrane subunit, partial [Chloroflexi bacterium]|nr:proton-conducting transporter membrane subunit [Chloroflexota bacterium]